jgi:DNA repair exonuclease SbcCD ATPase subunit
MTADNLPVSAELSEAHCPMCDAHSSTPAVEANKLFNAIEWLNNELKLSSYARESFVDERRKIRDELDGLNARLRNIQADIQPLDEEVQRLTTSKSINEQAIKTKLRLEIAIQDQLAKPESELSKLEKEKLQEVERLAALLSRYDIKDKLNELSLGIDVKMCELGNHFDFEETYKPSALRFDIETFDLWYQQDAKTRVYLRSMGSGANWLYSHLALFLALHYQFAAYSASGCKIPPILFLDQPTQVYFPASIDDANEFNAKELARQAKREGEMDEDMKAVTNMFTQLAKFCEETGEATGVIPQIIVSDHADKLQLRDGYKFPDYVRATWRTRGFIAEN